MADTSTRGFRLAYLLTSYPGLTTTFIDREISILRSLGVDLRVLALTRPDSLLSAGQKPIQESAIYIDHPGTRARLGAHLHFLSHHPLRYLTTLTYLLTRPHPSHKRRLSTLTHFSQGVLAARILKDQPVDHLHAHFINQAATVALVASRLTGIPYSVTAHASDIYVRPSMLREKMANARVVITCTGYNLKYLQEVSRNRLNGRLKCIYHGLDIGQFHRKGPIPTGRPMILGVGQLKERKGWQYLVEACRLLKGHGVDFECRIIGDGPLRETLEHQISSSGLEGQVRLCGALPMESVIQFYEQAALFALPAVLSQDGDRDGIPNVILEAMAMELPVVSTWHSGVPEAVDDGVSGLLVPPQDSLALAEAILRLLRHPEERVTFGRAGRRIVAEKFDPEKNARVLLAELTRR